MMSLFFSHDVNLLFIETGGKNQHHPPHFSVTFHNFFTLSLFLSLFMLRLLPIIETRWIIFSKSFEAKKTQTLETVKEPQLVKTYRRRTHTIKQKLGPPVLNFFFSIFSFVKTKQKSKRLLYFLSFYAHFWSLKQNILRLIFGAFGFWNYF